MKNLNLVLNRYFSTQKYAEKENFKGIYRRQFTLKYRMQFPYFNGLVFTLYNAYKNRNKNKDVKK